MAQCEVCGNGYDKAFQVTVARVPIASTALNPRSRRSRPPAPPAAAGLSVTAWTPTAACSAVPTGNPPELVRYGSSAALGSFGPLVGR
jgi:hypothetical protein